MPGLNSCHFIGHLGADPEIRYTAAGQAVTNFALAINRVWVERTERREEVDWVNVVAWGKLAENCGNYLRKGALAYVEGRQQTRSWEDSAGARHYRTEVVARAVQFLDRRGPEAAGDISPGDDFEELPLEALAPANTPARQPARAPSRAPVVRRS